MTRSRVIPILDPSGSGEARREALMVAKDVGFDSTEEGKLTILATEIATNIVKHAGTGSILLRVFEEQSLGVEIIGIDKGPGMPDIARCLEDGYSTAGSPGTGLGAISRMATYFEVYSLPGKGTVIAAQLRQGKATQPPFSLEIGVVCAPAKRGDECGDSWSVRHLDDKTLIMVVDGLGHGPLAARAADEAVRLFQSSPFTAGKDIIPELHAGLRSTRGASLAIAEVHPEAGVVRYSGVGNITAQVWTDGTSRGLISHNGTVGHELHRVNEFTYPWTPNSMLVMCSDGLVSRLSLETYPGLTMRHPSLVAGVLYRDFLRGKDDATALVARHSS